MEGIKHPVATTTFQIGRKRPNKKGFTLLELILSSLIIIILIGVSMPLFRKQFRDLELRNAAYNVAKLISFAQQKAIGDGMFYKLNFNFDKNEYWLTAGEGLDDFKKVKSKYGRVYSMPDGVNAKAAKAAFIFYPNGASDKIEITLSGKIKSLTLKSKGRLGHVKVERIEGQ